MIESGVWVGRAPGGRAAGARRGYVSVGAWVILTIAVIASAIVLARSDSKSNGLVMWTSAREHARMYRPIVEAWNASRQPPVSLSLLSGDALGRRMMSGFLSDTPVADCIEVERSLIGPTFAGPLDDVGFVDLTDRLKREGLYEQFNVPSFGPWTSRGRIFGLPHDVHPVMLAYRADLVEAAGIDVNQIETWDDFARAMRPLLDDRGPDGRPRHYPLNLWYTSSDQIEALILQAGGNYFDADGRPTMDSEVNARVLSTIVSWTGGPNRISADAPEFSASGNQMRLDGYVVCSVAPDWLGGVWKADLGPIAGKMKLMPLPAWTKGGRRTSVWGGTMLGIAKSSPRFDEAWAYAKNLYLNPALARELFETNGIISPVRSMWTQPFYDVPSPFFSGQKTGRLYIALAGDVPLRTSSPYNSLAKSRMQDASVALRQYAEANDAFDADKLMPEAHRVLAIAEAAVRRQIEKNVFLNAATKEQP